MCWNVLSAFSNGLADMAKCQKRSFNADLGKSGCSLDKHLCQCERLFNAGGREVAPENRDVLFWVSIETHLFLTSAYVQERGKFGVLPVTVHQKERGGVPGF